MTQAVGSDPTIELVQALVANAQRLGLIWTLQYATVINGAIPAAISVIIDGDTGGVPVPAVSVAGGFIVGQRVAVVSVPPAGLFVIGKLGGGILGSGSYSAASSGGSTASASAGNMPGSPAFTFTKSNELSKLDIAMTATAFASTVGSGVEIGLSFTDTVTYTVDITLGRLYFNAASSHMQVAGVTMTNIIPAGDVTVTARWSRYTGSGSITQDANDYVTFKVTELA